MGTKKKCGWDKKYDVIVGPGKKLQTLMARSIIGKLKTPFWFDFDKKMTKNLLLHIIYTLESMNYKVLVTVCDQAGENQGNLLKGIDKKTIRKQGIEPIKRVFTYVLFTYVLFSLTHFL